MFTFETAPLDGGAPCLFPAAGGAQDRPTHFHWPKSTPCGRRSLTRQGSWTGSLTVWALACPIQRGPCSHAVWHSES
ncbi:hypothetical protein CapIbe_020898 [Capra ibex]